MKNIQVLQIRADKLGSQQWDFIRRKSAALYRDAQDEIRRHGARFVRVGISLAGKASRPVNLETSFAGEFAAESVLA